MMREGEDTRCSSGRIWTRRIRTELDARSLQRWPVPWRAKNHVRISHFRLEIRSPYSHFLCMSCYSCRSRQFRNDVHAPRDRHRIPDGQWPWSPKPHAYTPPAYGAQARIAPLSSQPWLTQTSRCHLKLLNVTHRQAHKERSVPPRAHAHPLQRWRMEAIRSA